MTRFLLGVVAGFILAVFGVPPLIEWLDRTYPAG